MIKGEFDGLILAAAGVERLGMQKYITEYLEISKFLNAPGQGAIAVEIKKSNEELMDITSSINDEHTKITTTVERLFMKSMGGGCNYPIAAYSYIKNDIIFLDGLVISLDGKNYIRSSAQESIKDWDHLSDKLSEKFFNQGVEEILNEIRNASS